MDKVAQRYGSRPSDFVGAEGISALTLDLACAEEGAYTDQKHATRARHDALRLEALKRNG